MKTYISYYRSPYDDDDSNDDNRTVAVNTYQDSTDDLVEKLQQEQLKPYVNLACSGGGAKGAMYSGAYSVLSETGAIKTLQEVAGSSAGSIIASLAAFGVDHATVKQELQSRKFADFGQQDRPGTIQTKSCFGKPINVSNKPLREFVSTLIKDSTHKSINDDGFKSKFANLITKEPQKAPKLQQKYNALAEKITSNSSDMTFKDLELLRMIDPEKFKELHITAVRIKDYSLTIFNQDNTPEISVSEAVGASAAFPAAYKPVEINGIKYFDGGFIDNTPVSYFGEPKEKTLVFMFIDDLDKRPFDAIYSQKNLSPSCNIASIAQGFILKFVYSQEYSFLFSSYKSAVASYAIRNNHALNTITLNSKDIKTLDMEKADKVFDRLYNDGAVATAMHLLNQDRIDPTQKYEAIESLREYDQDIKAALDHLNSDCSGKTTSTYETSDATGF
jgi:NTE family protein